MEYGFSILMIAFAVCIFIYALILSTGEYGLIMKSHSAKVKNRRKYAKQFSKTLMLVSTAPLVSGIVGIFLKENVFPALITLFIMLVVTITIGVKCIKL